MTWQPIETATWNKFEGLSDPRLQPAYPCVPHESEYGWVLVWSLRGYVDMACLVWDDHAEELWHWSDQNGEEIHNVTHWMPLPEPPEEGVMNELCKSCNYFAASEESHTCPYASEIANDETKCTCCKYCEEQCAMNI